MRSYCDCWLATYIFLCTHTKPKKMATPVYSWEGGKYELFGLYLRVLTGKSWLLIMHNFIVERKRWAILSLDLRQNKEKNRCKMGDETDQTAHFHKIKLERDEKRKKCGQGNFMYPLAFSETIIQVRFILSLCCILNYIFSLMKPHLNPDSLKVTQANVSIGVEITYNYYWPLISPHSKSTWLF